MSDQDEDKPDCVRCEGAGFFEDGYGGEKPCRDCGGTGKSDE